MGVHHLKKPYLVLVGDIEGHNNTKTALGLRDWAGDACIGQLRLCAKAVDLRLPDMTPAQARAQGAGTLVVGISPVGGRLPAHYHPIIIEALHAGLNVASGLHQRLSDIAEIADCARKLGRQLHDVRHSDATFAIGSGARRTGRRLLTVGTDCALGKKYTALAIAREMQVRGMNAEFRATGQTGIMICGSGVAIDAVVADFIAGAAEALSPVNSDDHWDIVEGQGSLFHPAYAGVTLGLVHGSQPDALILCHDPTRTTLVGFPHIPIAPLDEAMSVYLHAARLTNPRARFVGLSLNTSSFAVAEAEAVLQHTQHLHGLPCVDPMRTGVSEIVSALQSFDD